MATMFLVISLVCVTVQVSPSSSLWTVYMDSLSKTSFTISSSVASDLLSGLSESHRFMLGVKQTCGGGDLTYFNTAWQVYGGFSTSPCGQAVMTNGRSSVTNNSRCLSTVFTSPDSNIERTRFMNFSIRIRPEFFINVTFLEFKLAESWPDCWAEYVHVTSLTQYNMPDQNRCGWRLQWTWSWGWTYNKPNYWPKYKPGSVEAVPSQALDILYRNTFRTCGRVKFIYQLHDMNMKKIYEKAVYHGLDFLVTDVFSAFRQYQNAYNIPVLMRTVRYVRIMIQVHFLSKIQYHVKQTVEYPHECMRIYMFDGPTEHSPILQDKTSEVKTCINGQSSAFIILFCIDSLAVFNCSKRIEIIYEPEFIPQDLVIEKQISTAGGIRMDLPDSGCSSLYRNDRIMCIYRVSLTGPVQSKFIHLTIVDLAVQGPNLVQCQYGGLLIDTTEYDYFVSC